MHRLQPVDQVSAILLETARELGARVLATGHYVASRPLADGSRALFRAREAERDQSYFLFCHPPRDPARAPALSRSASAPRRRRGRWRAVSGLRSPTSTTARDICFVPTGRYTEVIERLKPGAAEPGDIVDLSGRVLGRHDGIIHFTVGQRRGLGIAASAGRSTWCGSTRRHAASSSARARRLPHGACSFADRQLDRRRHA